MNVFDVLREKQDENSHTIEPLYNMPVNVIGLNVAIDIVNQVEQEYNNDVCEWKSSGISDEWKPRCEPNSKYNGFGVAWFRVCPYCGKKIKVVE